MKDKKKIAYLSCKNIFFWSFVDFVLIKRMKKTKRTKFVIFFFKYLGNRISFVQSTHMSSRENQMTMNH